MTERPEDVCDEVLAALMAALDGERPPLPAGRIEAHLQACDACRAAAVDLRALHQELTDVEYDGPRVDLWPAVSAQVVPSANARRERIAIAVIVALCLAWRTGQLLWDLPLPVVNTLVPLTALLLIGAWLVGDPLTIRMTPDLRQERA
jgi:anti-sigma factor RsiW